MRKQSIPDQDLDIASSEETDKRLDRLITFLSIMFEEDEMPLFISDSADLFDVCIYESNELKMMFHEKFGIDITNDLLNEPVWVVLDYIYESSPTFRTAVSGTPS